MNWLSSFGTTLHFGSQHVMWLTIFTSITQLQLSLVDSNFSSASENCSNGAIKNGFYSNWRAWRGERLSDLIPVYRNETNPYHCWYHDTTLAIYSTIHQHIRKTSHSLYRLHFYNVKKKLIKLSEDTDPWQHGQWRSWVQSWKGGRCICQSASGLPVRRVVVRCWWLHFLSQLALHHPTDRSWWAEGERLKAFRNISKE